MRQRVQNQARAVRRIACSGKQLKARQDAHTAPPRRTRTREGDVGVPESRQPRQQLGGRELHTAAAAACRRMQARWSLCVTACACVRAWFPSIVTVICLSAFKPLQKASQLAPARLHGHRPARRHLQWSRLADVVELKGRGEDWRTGGQKTIGQAAGMRGPVCTCGRAAERGQLAAGLLPALACCRCCSRCRCEPAGAQRRPSLCCCLLALWLAPTCLEHADVEHVALRCTRCSARCSARHRSDEVLVHALQHSCLVASTLASNSAACALTCTLSYLVMGSRKVTTSSYLTQRQAWRGSAALHQGHACVTATRWGAAHHAQRAALLLSLRRLPAAEAAAAAATVAAAAEACHTQPAVCNE